MALVNAFKFSKYQGAMICDEEYWINGRRRSFFQDPIQNLLELKGNDLILFYGGVGDPYFHYEVIKKSRKYLTNLVQNKNLSNIDVSPIYYLSKEVLKIAQKVTQNRINQKLKFLFGFDLDDFQRGNFKKDGKLYQIKQDFVRQKVLNIIKGKDKNKNLKEIMDSRALLMGYDKEDGIQLFYLNIENQVLSFNSGDYDTIGSGIYGAGHVFSEYIRRKTLQKRLQGYPSIEGLIVLVDSALTAKNTYKSIGGYFHIIYIDATKSEKERIKYIYEERSKLLTEIVDSYKRGFIKYKDCYELVEELIFNNESYYEINEKLFKRCSQPKLLEKYLRGYKIDVPLYENFYSYNENKKKEKNFKDNRNIKRDNKDKSKNNKS